jgi:YidC/Oxa1 family membrane protein insertase
LAEFKNPTQGPGGGNDSRSFLMMIVVMFAVILGLQWWQRTHNPPTPPPAAPAATAQQATPTAAPPVTTPGTASPAPATATPSIQAAAETSTVVENELYKITFTNRGGQVSSWVLKKFKNNAGQPLDLVHDAAATQFGYPLSLYTYDAGLTRSLAQGLYVASATGTLQAPASLSFNYAAGNIVVKKTFSFGADYVIHADTVVLRDGYPIRALVAWPGGFGDMENAQAYAQAQLDHSATGKDTHTAFKDVAGGATLSGPFDFAGVSDQYFAAIFMPDAPADATLATLHSQLEAKDIPNSKSLTKTDFQPAAGPTTTKGYLRLPILGAAMGDLSGHNQTRLFVGPKALPVLKSVKTADGNTLGTVLDFGFWGPVGKGLYLSLHFVQEHIVSNWGWAIVLFTVIINLVLLPLRVTGMRSMVKMQRIQPQVDLIKAKYKNPGPTDPKAAEMNAEVMAYQKEQGVSMFGGCIPSLIQLPLLLAFFTMMNRVVELRQSHWLWIHDISLSDPYKILPIVMVVTSFLVQFYTPSPGVDPQQQRMMAFMMPLVSGYMTWNYAAALAIYWNVGNFIMILQQQVMNRTSLGKELRELQAQRARAKAAGSSGIGSGRPGGKTIQGRK